MEIYFNELSFSKGTQVQYEDIERLSNLYKELIHENISVCRVSSENQNDLIRQVKDIKGS